MRLSYPLLKNSAPNATGESSHQADSAVPLCRLLRLQFAMVLAIWLYFTMGRPTAWLLLTCKLLAVPSLFGLLRLVWQLEAEAVFEVDTLLNPPGGCSFKPSEGIAAASAGTIFFQPL